MKSNEVADESYSINGFKHFSDLAVAYFPNGKYIVRQQKNA